MGSKVYTKQCMCNLKLSHGAVEKNYSFTCFLKEVRKMERDEAILR